jgi:UDP-galactopyranose mutase
MIFDCLIVGCGLSGTTCARLLAERGRRVLIIDKRNHIGGNAYDCYNDEGILIHRYGPHIFHTQFRRVWDFLSRFTRWRLYHHRVLAYVDGKLVPMPINLNTINLLFNTSYTEQTIGDFYKNVKNDAMPIKNARDTVVSKVGERLYDLFFKGYTKKQWDLYPEDLEPEVTARIPIRYNRADHYFDDPYQGIPIGGYTQMAAGMLDHPLIQIMLNTEYKLIRNEIAAGKTIYTGPMDEYFDYQLGKLPYRSIEFQFETIDKPDYQPVAVVNYPNDYDFTRITEYKWMTGQVHPKTTIVKEYPNSEGEPYYPIPRAGNRELYDRYKTLADKEENVYFLGRLGRYQYLNMDLVVKEAMELAEKLDQY